MPIFEYQCDACGATFERLTLRPQATAQVTCPQCGSPRTAKVFSTFSTASGSNGAVASRGNPAFS